VHAPKVGKLYKAKHSFVVFNNDGNLYTIATQELLVLLNSDRYHQVLLTEEGSLADSHMSYETFWFYLAEENGN